MFEYLLVQPSVSSIYCQIAAIVNVFDNPIANSEADEDRERDPPKHVIEMFHAKPVRFCSGIAHDRFKLGAVMPVQNLNNNHDDEAGIGKGPQISPVEKTSFHNLNSLNAKSFLHRRSNIRGRIH